MEKLVSFQARLSEVLINWSLSIVTTFLMKAKEPDPKADNSKAGGDVGKFVNLMGNNVNKLVFVMATIYLIYGDKCFLVHVTL